MDSVREERQQLFLLFICADKLVGFFFYFVVVYRMAGDRQVKQLAVSTPREGFVNITGEVMDAIREIGIREGICQVFVPHTTAGVTINENADPDVVTDMLRGLNAMVPNIAYRHSEGNSPAHIKASLLGVSVTIPIDNGVLLLGTWQGIYLCEFDGPRRRTVCVNWVGQ